MNNKQEGLYKFEFYRYFRALLTTAPVPRSKQPAFVLPIFSFVLFIMLYTVITSACPVSDAMAFLSLMAFAAALAVGECMDFKPSLASLMPVSERKRLLYRFTSSILMFFRILIYVLVGMVLAFIAVAIILLIVNAVSGVESGSSTEGGSAIGVNMGLHGGIFAAAFFVISFCAGVIAGYFKKSKHKNWFLAGFVCAVVLAFVLTGLPGFVMSKKLHPEIAPSIAPPYIEACYENMPVAWLCTLLWCVAAAGSLFAAIYLGFKKIKATEF